MARRSREVDALLIIRHQHTTQIRKQRGGQNRDSRRPPYPCKFTASLQGAAQGLALVVPNARYVLVELPPEGIPAHRGHRRGEMSVLWGPVFTRGA